MDVDIGKKYICHYCKDDARPFTRSQDGVECKYRSCDTLVHSFCAMERGWRRVIDGLWQCKWCLRGIYRPTAAPDEC